MLCISNAFWNIIGETKRTYLQKLSKKWFVKSVAFRLETVSYPIHARKLQQSVHFEFCLLTGVDSTFPIKKVSSRDLTKRPVRMYTQYLKPVFFLETLKGK
jgi:hypothetical protein